MPKRTQAITILILCLAAVALALLAAWRLNASSHSSAAPTSQDIPVSSAQNTALPATASSPAAPTSQDIQVPSARGTQIPATVVLPANAESGHPMPLVVFCPAFTGTREGDGHYAPLAQNLAQAGIASIRIDFPGMGESTESTVAYTPENWRSDIDSAFAYMREHYAIDADHLGIVGHSMGGRAATLYLSSTTNPICAAALWSPADAAGLNGLEFLDQSVDELRAEAEANGSVTCKWGVELSAAFFEQCATDSPPETLKAYPGALLLSFAGESEDSLFPVYTRPETTAAAEARGLLFTDLTNAFSDATHNYTSLTGDAAEDAALNERLVSATTQFFEENLQ